ncbi:putative ph domain-containing protein [Lasiodiplodia theobromae]|uniref:Ph domain-containing protein n=1 Tax=Lasiodiplodia theobromae TaxID=45133 RepID=UPI0015C30E2D|nr:Ph domain-containing protein [Lasiodiplodia theobromae]KAF4538056.1 Ph domain-containing protein [Lasiodiplodia theobromae]KAF9638512.1 putative ph domain-containing protein [Lasiodiplodia theobromae]
MSASALGAALFRQHTAMMQSQQQQQQPAAPTADNTRAQATPAAATTTATTTTTANCYGYHNTFHTHAQPADLNAKPPAYAPRQPAEKPARDALPSYSCSVLFEGPLGIKTEYINFFDKPCPKERQWQDVYVVLRGTQLSIYRLKTGLFSSKTKKAVPGRLIRTYSLQHAELGLALDFKKTDLIPKSPLAKLVPLNSRQAVYQTDPHLFWPIREHVMRLRLEADQLLLCAAEQEGMLNWVEQLCAAVDISSPLEDRSEPRYRSLPRRGRRQRQLDGRQTRQDAIDLNARRLLAEQERIIRTMYPNLARDAEEEQPEQPEQPLGEADGDAEDFAMDLLFPNRPSSPRPGNISNSSTQNMDDATDRTTSRRASVDSQLAPTSAKYPLTENPQPSASSTLRYRRRCAPVLLANSPRASDVLFCDGMRVRVNVKKQIVMEFHESPPHYSAHRFTAADREAALRTNARPDVRREASNDSVAMSFHRDADADLTPVASRSTQQRSELDDIESHQADQQVHESTPPSPAPVQLTKVETEGERSERRLLDRVKGPLTGVAEAFGGLVV